VTTPAPFVSTGRLPAAKRVQALVTEAHERFRSNDEGAVSTVYPALGRMGSDLFGVCVVGTDANIYAAGDFEVDFTIMSVAKPFTFALVCQALGPEHVRSKVGINATGRPFNSVEGVEVVVPP
jgi:glutaminase